MTVTVNDTRREMCNVANTKVDGHGRPTRPRRHRPSRDREEPNR